MNKKLSLIRNQIYFATRQIGFWVGTFVLFLYVIVTFVYYCLQYWGSDAASVLDPSEMFAFHEYAPFWQMFSLILPLVCALNFAYQNTENRESGAIRYISLRSTAKAYWNSILVANFLLTFLQVEAASLLSMLLNRIAFPNTRVLFEGAEGTSTFWKNLDAVGGYTWQNIHLNHPWLYLLLYSVLFAVFCSVLSHFLYAVSLLIKKEGLWIIAASALVSFFINEMYSMGDYNIWNDVIVSAKRNQSGMITLVVCLLMGIFGKVLVSHRAARWWDE